MKKILLVVTLLVAVIAVSAIKTYREHSQRDASFEKGKQESADQLDQSREMADSIKLAMGEKEVEFADSLTRVSRAYRSNLDSLEDVIDSQTTSISALKKKVADVPRKTQATQKTSQPSALSQHEKILTYYKQRYADLPKDLSEYEKRIALNEIREETARRFSISVSELEKIRQSNNVNY